MFVKTEFMKYYSQEACRSNLFNVIQGHRGEKVVKTWTLKYNFFGFSPVNDHFICVGPLLNVHHLFFHTSVRIGWNQEITNTSYGNEVVKKNLQLAMNRNTVHLMFHQECKVLSECICE